MGQILFNGACSICKRVIGNNELVLFLLPSDKDANKIKEENGSIQQSSFQACLDCLKVNRVGDDFLSNFYLGKVNGSNLIPPSLR